MCYDAVASLFGRLRLGDRVVVRFSLNFGGKLSGSCDRPASPYLILRIYLGYINLALKRSWLIFKDLYRDIYLSKKPMSQVSASITSLLYISSNKKQRVQCYTRSYPSRCRRTGPIQYSLPCVSTKLSFLFRNYEPHFLPSTTSPRS
jgi:hypothetical protein